MSDEKPLIEINDVLGLSKPVTALIEKISEAGVGLFRPTQIKRVAKAEAEANKIHALMDMDISDIQQRAMKRLVHEEAKKQENMEEITLEAAKLVKDDAKPEDMDNDWIANFFDKCRLVSDKEMQGLWSKLLAGEANKTGTYSKRTVNLVAGLDKSDAQLFTNFFTYGWYIHTDVIALIYNPNQDEIYYTENFNYRKLFILDNSGLINYVAGTSFSKSLPKIIEVGYHGELFTLDLGENARLSNQVNLNEQYGMNAGSVLLTESGKQLAPICGAKPSEEFMQYVLGKWRSLGYTVEEITPTPIQL